MAAKVFAGLWLVALGMCAVALYPFVQYVLVAAREIQVVHPDRAVRDARALVADRNANPQKYGPYTEPRALPESLRIRDLRYAKVHQDHVDLVFVRNPDGSAGARIWSERHRPHRDKRTRYPGIHSFRYTHEMPETADNIP